MGKVEKEEEDKTRKVRRVRITRRREEGGNDKEIFGGRESGYEGGVEGDN